jgi:hemerythrin
MRDAPGSEQKPASDQALVASVFALTPNHAATGRVNMKALVWDQVLSVGNDEIDHDHRILVDLFNLLGRSVNEGAARAYVGAVLEELINCTAWHFSHEERLMLKHGYEGFEDHRQEHRELIETVRKLQQEYRQGGTLEEREFEILERWLTEHILVSDMAFGAFLVDAA